MATATETITAHHRDRHAYMYVRQSTLRQVQQHRESQTNQYALVERAQALGWHPERIHIISADLGQSGQDSSRPGFQELVAEVSLGHVGIVLAYEASRLARNNADWYTLLDLAAVMGTLLADTEGVYDPRAYNDRLLLGLRGMFSEAELHLLHLRLEAGRMRQVERGSYQQQLPTGLLRLPDGQVVKDPDVSVQQALDLVFERFRALRSCQKVLRALRDAGICLPRRQTWGPAAGTLVWKRPTADAIYEVVRNPAYAGAFVTPRFILRAKAAPIPPPETGRSNPNRPKPKRPTSSLTIRISPSPPPAARFAAIPRFSPGVPWISAGRAAQRRAGLHQRPVEARSGSHRADSRGAVRGNFCPGHGFHRQAGGRVPERRGAQPDGWHSAPALSGRFRKGRAGSAGRSLSAEHRCRRNQQRVPRRPLDPRRDFEQQFPPLRPEPEYRPLHRR